MGRRGGDFKTYFETYIRYSRVADEEQKKRYRANKSVILKRILDILKLQMKKDNI